MAFLLSVWLYVVYLFGVLIPYTIRGTIPWLFIGKSYLVAVNYNTHYQVMNYHQPTIGSLLPGSMPFLEKWIIIAEYAVLNDPIIPEVMLVILVAFGIYIAVSGVFRAVLTRNALHSN